MATSKLSPPKPKSGSIELYSPQYFAACGLGGVVSCGPTHTGTRSVLFSSSCETFLLIPGRSCYTPRSCTLPPSFPPLPTTLFPVAHPRNKHQTYPPFPSPQQVKCRRQVDPSIYTSNLSAWRSIFRAEGLRGVFFGWSPTFIGYSFQGAGKYGFYEVFKYTYGSQFPNANKTLVYLAASASAEFLADIALCPFEAVKVRMQTTLPPYANNLRDGWGKVTSKEGVAGLYKGLQPLWGRQIPYTMVKFATFESTVNAIYGYLGKPKESYNGLQQTGVSFLGGYIAGIGCAVISHPADVMVSKLNADRQRKFPISLPPLWLVYMIPF